MARSPRPMHLRHRILAIGCMIGAGSFWACNAPEMTSPPEAEVPPLPSAWPLPAPSGPLPPLDPPQTPAASTDALTKVVASSGDSPTAFDHDPQTAWAPAKAQPSWIAVQLKEPAPERVILAWHASGNRFLNYLHAPKTYTIEWSTDSQDGTDGHWQTAYQAQENHQRTRADLITAPGARWVRLSVQETWSSLKLSEIDVRVPQQAGPPDVLTVLGDSITHLGFALPSAPDFQAVFAGTNPRRRPIVIDGGTPGITAETGEQYLSLVLQDCLPGTVVGLAYGTNDVNRQAAGLYHDQLQRMINALRLRGCVPLLARPPWTGQSRLTYFLEAVDELTKRHGLPPGPDFYSWFQAHPDELREDRVHPNAKGIASIQRLWGEAYLQATMPQPK